MRRAGKESHVCKLTFLNPSRRGRLGGDRCGVGVGNQGRFLPPGRGDMLGRTSSGHQKEASRVTFILVLKKIARGPYRYQ